MKLAIRIFALTVVFVGVAAATVSSSNSDVIASHQAAATDLPVPQCGPGIPGCPQTGGGNVQ
jgi:nucleoside phosphorylase